MTRLFRVGPSRLAMPLTFALFLVVGGAYGFFAEVFADVSVLLSITLVVSIMHFWWDGFIWSVRKKQV